MISKVGNVNAEKAFTISPDDDGMGRVLRTGAVRQIRCYVRPPGDISEERAKQLRDAIAAEAKKWPAFCDDPHRPGEAMPAIKMLAPAQITKDIPGLPNMPLMVVLEAGIGGNPARLLSEHAPGQTLQQLLMDVLTNAGFNVESAKQMTPGKR